MSEDSLHINSKSKTVVHGPLLTWLACAICVLIFIGISNEKVRSWDTLSKWGYFSPNAIWDGKYFALLSSVFVHLQLWHLAFNVYWLWVLGGALERSIGLLRWLAFFVIAAIISSGIQLAISSTTGVGASGVVYAMFGFMWVARDRYAMFAASLPKQTIILFVAWLILCVITTFLKIWNIGNWAHISGLLFGVGIAAIFVLKYRVRQIIIAEAVLVALAIIPLFWCPWSMIWVSNKAYDAHFSGDYQSAISWYKRSLKLGQDPIWVWSNLAISYKTIGDQENYKDALQQLRKFDVDAAKEIEEDVQDGH